MHKHNFLRYLHSTVLWETDSTDLCFLSFSSKPFKKLASHLFLIIYRVYRHKWDCFAHLVFIPNLFPLSSHNHCSITFITIFITSQSCSYASLLCLPLTKINPPICFNLRNMFHVIPIGIAKMIFLNHFVCEGLPLPSSFFFSPFLSLNSAPSKCGND